MKSHRGSWLRSSLLAASLSLVPAATTVRAQPGFGADPFWPYNNQYTPYVTAVGPADPVAGGRGAAMLPESGLRGANQFQEYLEGLYGREGRNNSDRATVGMPYYRSAVDPSFDPKGRGSRQYQPNARVNERFEDTQRRVADTYFAYYSERDPARRAELLKEYREARRESSVALTNRGQSSSREFGSSNRLDAGSRRTTRPSAPRAGATDRMRSQTGRFGPAPNVPLVGSGRSSSPTPRRGSSPTDVLNRSRAMDRDEGLRALPGLPGSSSRSRSRSALTPPTSDSVETPGAPRP
jgi:hypothetical protein